MSSLTNFLSLGVVPCDQCTLNELECFVHANCAQPASMKHNCCLSCACDSAVQKECLVCTCSNGRELEREQNRLAKATEESLARASSSSLSANSMHTRAEGKRRPAASQHVQGVPHPPAKVQRLSSSIDVKDGKDAKVADIEPASAAVVADADVGIQCDKDAFAIANHGRRLARDVPMYIRPLWANTCGPLFKDYIEAKDEQAQYRAIKAILQLPARALFITRRDKGVSYSSAMRDQIAAASRHPAVAAAPFARARAAEARFSAEESRLRRAKACLKVGETKRAVRVLLEGPALNTEDPQVLQQLKSLFPPAAPTPVPVLPPGAAAPILQEEEVSKLVRRLSRCVAPGPSGWTYDLIKSACSSSLVLKGFTKLVNDITSGSLHSKSAALLLACRGIPLAKRAGGVRPLGIGEAFYRVAASHVVSLVAKDAGLVLAPWQFAIGVNGGAQTAIQLLQDALHDGLIPRALLLLDGRNSFNAIHTQAALAGLFKHEKLAPLFRLAHWAYSSPTPVFVQANGTVVSQFLRQTGVAQGDPLGMLLFAVAAHPLLAAIADATPDTRVVAFADDISVATLPSSLPEILDLAVSEASKIGLEFVLRKCQLFWPHRESLPPSIIRWAQEKGIRVVTTAADLLGGVVGLDVPAMSAALLEKVNGMAPLFECVQSGKLTTQEAFAIISACNINHLLRACPPTVTNAAAVRFDHLREQAALIKNGIKPHEITPDLIREIRLPFQQGGANLISATETAGFCYFAARAEAARFLATQSLGEVQQLALSQTLASIIQNCKSVDSATLPQSADSFRAFYSATRVPQLQRVLTRSYHGAMGAAILSEAKTDEDKARLLCNRAPKSALWLRAKSSDPLDDASFSIGFRFRFGLNPLSEMPDGCCSLCKKRIDFQVHPWHPIDCQAIRGTMRTKGHNCVVNIFAGWTRQLGGDTIVEPRGVGVDNSDLTRPDTDTYMAPKRFFADVKIVNPRALSHVKCAAKSMLATAAAAEKEKRDKYEGKAHARNAAFYPLVLETTGGMGKSCAVAIGEIIKAAKNVHLWAPHEVVHGIKSRMSVAVQRWNARIVLAGLRHNLD